MQGLAVIALALATPGALPAEELRLAAQRGREVRSVPVPCVPGFIPMSHRRATGGRVAGPPRPVRVQRTRPCLRFIAG